VILVSKDINMRIKARALGLEAQDYFNDRCWKTPTCSTPACCHYRTISGLARQGHEVVAEGRPHLL